MAEEHPTAGTFVTVYLILLVLLVVTVAANSFEAGLASFAIAVLIATIKALLIVLYFMHVRYSPPLIWVVASGGTVWLALMIGLTYSDYVSRGWLQLLP